MSTSRSKRATGLAAVASAALLLTLAGPAAAAEPAWEFDFPAGSACSFDLHVAGYGDGSQVYREFEGPNGSLRTLTAGTGNALVFSANGNTLSTRANGAVNWTTYNADGSMRLDLQGHNVVLLSSTDVGGPSAILYVGKAVVDITAGNVWTVTKTAGTAMDICGALS